jgi:hypothetical protein
MTYDELNKTNPYNYYPTGDSARFELPEDKVSKFRRLWKKHHPKKRQDDFTANEPVSMPPTETDKMIVVGGLVGEGALDRYKHLAAIAKGIWDNPHLVERKSTRKRKTKNPSVVPDDARSKKMRRLVGDSDHWPNLE